MLQQISENITNYFVKKNIVSIDNKEVIQYGVEITISEALGTSLVIIFGLIFGCFFESIIYLLLLGLLKSNTGGYHANSYLACNMFTVCIFLANVFLYKYINGLPNILWILFSIFATIIIGIFSPCEHRNHPLSDQQKKCSKIKGTLISCAIIAISFLLSKLQMRIFIFVILVQITICINMIVGLKLYTCKKN